MPVASTPLCASRMQYCAIIRNPPCYARLVSTREIDSFEIRQISFDVSPQNPLLNISNVRSLTNEWEC